MSVLKPLEKIVKKIEAWQEDCASLQHGLRTLLGENTSIADISVNPNGFEKKKKTIKTEATITTDSSGKIRKQVGTKEIPVDRQKAQEIKSALDKGRMIVSGDEPEKESKEKTVSNVINLGEPDPSKIQKTIAILKTNSSLKKWVEELFKNRMSGNISRVKDLKSMIDDEINSKDLDPLTVYSSSTDIEEPEESDDGEEENVEGKEDTSETEDKKGK